MNPPEEGFPPASLNPLLYPNFTFDDWAPIETAPRNRFILVRTKNDETIVALKMPIHGTQDSDSPLFSWEARLGQLVLTLDAEDLKSWCWIPGIALQ